MDNQQGTVSEFEIGWIVGIIDGEGCFGLHYHCYDHTMTPSITVTNTNCDIIEEFSSILTRLNLSHHVQNKKAHNNRCKPQKKVTILGLKRVKAFLNIFFERFNCRYQQAKVLKDFVDLRLSKDLKDPYTSDEHSLFSILRELNKRGI